MSERIYQYFVSYIFAESSGSRLGYGNNSVETYCRIVSLDQVREIEDELSRTLKAKIVVTNWKLLRSVKKGSGSPPENDEKAEHKDSPSKVD